MGNVLFYRERVEIAGIAGNRSGIAGIGARKNLPRIYADDRGLQKQKIGNQSQVGGDPTLRMRLQPSLTGLEILFCANPAVPAGLFSVAPCGAKSVR
jgi:hypothetical protein